MQLILLITKHSLCVTCGSQWSVKLEEVAHSFLRVIPCIQTGFWTEFWLDIFFLEGKCQNLILFNQNHFKREVRYCFEIYFPARRKAIRATVAELHNFFSTYGNILLKKSQDYSEKNTNLGTFLGKNERIKRFLKNLKITSLNKGDKYLSIKLRRKKQKQKQKQKKKRINGCWDINFFMEKVCVIFRTSESFCASWRHGCLSSPRKFIWILNLEAFRYIVKKRE